MSTLAEKFHDSFDAYYSGKKTGWTVQKTARRPDTVKQGSAQTQQNEGASEQAAVESRH